MHKVTIKKGVVVMQDFSFFKWKDDVVFDIESVTSQGRLVLTADGYGSERKYGDGKVYVFDKDDVIDFEVKPREWNMAITENGSPISIPTIGIPVLFSNDYKIIKVREVI